MRVLPRGKNSHAHTHTHTHTYTRTHTHALTHSHLHTFTHLRTHTLTHPERAVARATSLRHLGGWCFVEKLACRPRAMGVCACCQEGTPHTPTLTLTLKLTLTLTLTQSHTHTPTHSRTHTITHPEQEHQLRIHIVRQRLYSSTVKKCPHTYCPLNPKGF